MGHDKGNYAKRVKWLILAIMLHESGYFASRREKGGGSAYSLSQMQPKAAADAMCSKKRGKAIRDYRTYKKKNVACVVKEAKNIKTTGKW